MVRGAMQAKGENSESRGSPCSGAAESSTGLRQSASGKGRHQWLGLVVPQQSGCLVPKALLSALWQHHPRTATRSVVLPEG